MEEFEEEVPRRKSKKWTDSLTITPQQGHPNISP